MAIETVDQTRSDDPSDPRTRPPSADFLALRDEVRTQGEAMRNVQRAFTIFAVFGFMIAAATFAAVIAKLDAKTTVTASAPVAKAAPAAKPVAPVAAVHAVNVKLSEFVVDTSSRTAAPGKVTFAVRNTGKVTHEFVVLRTDKPAAELLKGGEADETGNVGEIGDVPVGASKTLSLNLKAGHYALICNLPGHYQAGQYADLTVK